MTFLITWTLYFIWSVDSVLYMICIISCIVLVYYDCIISVIVLLVMNLK